MTTRPSHLALVVGVFALAACSSGGDGTKSTATSPTGATATVASTAAAAAAAAPDTEIVFGCGRDLCVSAPDGSGKRVITFPEVAASDPTWSPDGTKIAFTGFTEEPGNPSLDDNNNDVYVVNTDGSNLVRLTDEPEFDGHPSWSPEGTKIAFQSSRFAGQSTEIMVIGADGSGLTRLTDSAGGDEDPAWSPDGAKIAFVSNRGGGDDQIWVMNADRFGPVQLSVDGGDSDVDAQQPAWSPDGTRIAFKTFRFGYDSEILVMDADGSNGQRLTNNEANDSHPAWSPDGERIAFDSEPEDSATRIFVVNADGSDAVEVASGEEPAWAR